MKAVLQRVSSAGITIDREYSNGEIGQGLTVLLGVMEGDTKAQAEFLAKKICGLRVFSDEQGKQNLSLQDIDGEMMIVSNFTLGADCRHGRRPFYAQSAAPDIAEELYDYFISCVKQEAVKKVVTGVFGAHMDLHIEADGPVTIILDTQELGK